jgi:hypothetical protein
MGEVLFFISLPDTTRDQTPRNYNYYFDFDFDDDTLVVKLHRLCQRAFKIYHLVKLTLRGSNILPH